MQGTYAFRRLKPLPAVGLCVRGWLALCERHRTPPTVPTVPGIPEVIHKERLCVRGWLRGWLALCERHRTPPTVPTVPEVIHKERLCERGWLRGLCVRGWLLKPLPACTASTCPVARNQQCFLLVVWTLWRGPSRAPLESVSIRQHTSAYGRAPPSPNLPTRC